MNTEVKTPTAQDLLGVWNLVRWEITYDDGRPTTYPFGPNSTGLIMYTHDGGMHRPCRPRATLQRQRAQRARGRALGRVREFLSVRRAL
jgi:hypothetical protein